MLTPVKGRENNFLAHSNLKKKGGLLPIWWKEKLVEPEGQEHNIGK